MPVRTDVPAFYASEGNHLGKQMFTYDRLMELSRHFCCVGGLRNVPFHPVHVQ